MGFSRQEYWSGLPFPSPVDHVFSEVSTMTCPSWVALHGMAHSFIKTRLWSMWSNWLFFCDCGFQSVCPLMEKDKRLMEASWWERLTERETGSCASGPITSWQKDGETDSRRAQKNLVCTRIQEKGAVTPEENDPDLPVSLQKSPVVAWVDSGLLQV